MPLTSTAETFLCCFGITRFLYKRFKSDLLNHRLEYWKIRLIGGIRAGNPTDVNVLNYLNMLSSRNIGDINVDVAYMAEETE